LEKLKPCNTSLQMRLGKGKDSWMKTVAIVNPTAGWGRAVKDWPRLLAELGPAGITTWWSRWAGHSELLAAKARREGFDRVVAVGGDGTLFQVLNGLWWEPEGSFPSVGMVPFGTACDYPRNFDLGRRRIEQLATALGSSTVSVNAGTCRLQGMDGRPTQRAFIMVLGAGFDANVVKRFKQQRIWKHGKISYFVSGLHEILRLKACRFQGEADGQGFEGEGILLAASLGRYFAGRMMIAPSISPGSDAMQIMRMELPAPLDLLPLVMKLYCGKHTRHPKVHIQTARHLKVSADPPAFVEADGEPIGITPMEITFHPRAFQFAAVSLL
jgi:YegS/Rv2252/BmrU family lipid kinase